ncbi:DUF4136 domain-containing protein [Pseudochryseolinea flava]|uniref:DUF4136 domain-containing protein n=1 Tax=Pseudochryseolinea flava TaxID=2059302 RepID=A0A364Y1W3_9BACT|nr:DUF4136 domain-containing protein [Pseudochryseolinea flava]RAW00728.1 hypothetical protein DQQ10_14205 [Pseudochryseolinea flava]
MFKKIFILFPAVVFVLGSCQNEPDDIKLYDELVVSTQYDNDADFSAYQSYAIATDTIGYVSGNPKDTIRVYKGDFPYPRLVINAVKSAIGTNLEQKNIDQDPDVGINIYVVSELNLYQQVVYPTYGYYGGYSGYYYPYTLTYAQNTATLVVEMVDLKNRDAQNRVRVVWSAYMGDVISSVDYEKQSVDAIAQAFKQSSYLFK